MRESVQELRDIECDPANIGKITTPTEDEQLLAIELDPNSIQHFFEHATVLARQRALEIDPTTIRFFTMHTPEEERYVIHRVRNGYKLIDHLSPSGVRAALLEALLSNKFFPC